MFEKILLEILYFCIKWVSMSLLLCITSMNWYLAFFITLIWLLIYCTIDYINNLDKYRLEDFSEETINILKILKFNYKKNDIN